MKLVNVGFGSVVSAGRIVAMISPESAPIKRLTQEARERGNLVDASFGRKTQCVLIMDSGDLKSRETVWDKEREDEKHV